MRKKKPKECSYCGDAFRRDGELKPVKLNRHGLCVSCRKQFPGGTNKTFKNDHDRYVKLILHGHCDASGLRNAHDTFPEIQY